MFEVVLFIFLKSAFAEIPSGNEILEGSTSPDGRWAITVPTLEEFLANDNSKNLLISKGSNDVVLTFNGWSGRPNTGHVDTAFAWSRDSKHLLWVVHGKWAPLAVACCFFDEDSGIKQFDILKLGQEEILARLKHAQPTEYEAAVKDNEGNGEAFPDGFTIDLKMNWTKADPPLRFTLGLSSNPKRVERVTDLEAVLVGTLDKNHNVTWADFRSFKMDEIQSLRTSLSRIELKLQHEVERLEMNLTGSARKNFQEEQERWREKLQEQLGTQSELGFSFGGYLEDKAHYESMEARLSELSRR